MDKVLVEIRVPAADAKFDAFIPQTSKGSEVLEIVKGIFTSMFEGKYKQVSDSVLCVYDTGKLLDINRTMYEQSKKNGTKLVLI